MAISALHAPYEQLFQYTRIATDVQTGLRKPIDQYLASGNTVQLATAGKQLKSTLDTDFNSLPDEVTVKARCEATKLKKFLSADLRAAGKLSGNEQGSLLQSEHKMRYAMSSLND